MRGIRLVDRFIVKAQLFHDSGPEVLNHHVGAFEKFAHLAAVLFLFQVGSEAFLVPVDRMKECAVSVEFEV